MGIFNVLESFFIFSLAILFILVGLLLYHIRGKINAGEQRIDTLYEMTAKLSNEIRATRVYIENLKYINMTGGYDENRMDTHNIIPFQPSMPHLISVKKIVVSDDDNSDDNDGNSDDDDGNSDDDDDDGNSDDDDDNNSDDDDNFDDGYVNDISNDVSNDVSEIDIFEIDVSDNGYINDVSDIEEQEQEQEPEQEQEQEQEQDQEQEQEQEHDDIDTKITNNIVDVKNIEQIESLDIIELIQETNEDSNTTTNNILNTQTDLEYNKMNLPSLKKIAIERGLSNNYEISKMKKNEIITLLTNI